MREEERRRGRVTGGGARVRGEGDNGCRLIWVIWLRNSVRVLRIRIRSFPFFFKLKILFYFVFNEGYFISFIKKNAKGYI